MKHLVILMFLMFSFASWSVQIFFRDLEGKTKTLDLDLKEDTVWDVKERVCEKTELPPEFQRLIFNGKQLENDKTLSDYKIEAGSTLVILLQLYVK